MKYLKIVTILSIAASASIALPGVASATVFTSPPGTIYTSTIKASNEYEHMYFHNNLAGFRCSSNLESKVERHGSGVTGGGTLSALSFSCTDNVHVQVVKRGSFEAHALGNGNGTLTSNGMTIEVNFTQWGFTCRYATNATDLGTLTGSSSPWEEATLDISSKLPFHGGTSIFCGSDPLQWTGSYVVYTPSSLLIH